MTTKIQLPLVDSTVLKSLRIGDEVLLSGQLYTARDAAHKFLASNTKPLPDGMDLEGGALYHCGPVVVRDGDGWRITAAGPTTSAREEAYEDLVMERYGVKVILGKGGMGPKTSAALQRFGGVYLSCVGGAAQVLAAAVTRVRQVYFLEEFGSPEAVWALDIQDFPAIVTMDSHGGNIHAEILNASQDILNS